jgi:hypothetical protein
MRWTCWMFCVLGALGGIGCQALERQRLEEERATLELAQNDIRGYMDQAAPVGSRWTSHPDTAQFLEQMKRNDTRIAEIDRQLGSR